MEPDIRVEIVTDHHIAPSLGSQLVRAAVAAAAHDQGFRQGNIGVRITDDATIQQINLDHLGHDYPTDVISFDYGSDQETIEGEMVVSAEMAAACAAEFGWPTDHELTLYIVHGTLHIAGLDDLSDSDRKRMRSAEMRVMLSLGIEAITRCGPATVADSNLADSNLGRSTASPSNLGPGPSQPDARPKLRSEEKQA